MPKVDDLGTVGAPPAVLAALAPPVEREPEQPAVEVEPEPAPEQPTLAPEPVARPRQAKRKPKPLTWEQRHVHKKLWFDRQQLALVQARLEAEGDGRSVAALVKELFDEWLALPAE